MDIEDNNQPVTAKPYKISPTERTKIDSIVKEWKRLVIVTETNSSYSSPVLLVTKKDGEPRLVVDYRKLNQQTIKKTFPVADIDDLLQGLTEAKTEEAKHKSAFITPTETGQFERMMFGITNAPFVFSKLMAKVLGQLRENTAVWYLDDMLIPAVDLPDMLTKLDVLIALKDSKLTLKLTKCRFSSNKVYFLGFTLSTQGLKPGYRKTSAIEQFPTPLSKHDVRRFLGLLVTFAGLFQTMQSQHDH